MITGHQRPHTAVSTRSRRRRVHGSHPQQQDHGFAELFENASDIIVINDRTGRVVAANRAARDFGGYTQEDVARGVSLRDVLTPEDYEKAMLVTLLL